MPYIKTFKITRLFGYKDVEINHKSDIIILVGENGTGKSTIMNCLYYLLTKNFQALVKIPFETIEIVFQTGKKFFFRHKDIAMRDSIRLGMSERRFINYLNEELKIHDFQLINNIFDSNNSYSDKLDSVMNLLQVKKIKSTARYSPDTIYMCVKAIYDDIKAFNFEQQIETLDKYLYPSDQVFHLTTYRRVEANFIDEDNSDRKIVYSVNDVDKMLSSIQNEINERNKIGFNNMMVSMLNKLCLKHEHSTVENLDLKKVQIVLARLGSKLSKELHDSIIDYCQNDRKSNKELDYLIEELIKLYEQQEDLDKLIDNFCNRCNKYLRGKQFVYDDANVNVVLRSDFTDESLALDTLSSGEKQMVGLMAKMYLSKESNFIVLIDEPELSLSISWQQHILEDMIQSGKVRYMMAVTHSPFIYDNNLQQYAIGMSNFVINNK